MVNLILISCSVERFIPEDKYLYTGAEVKIIAEDTIKELDKLQIELETVLRPKPNKEFLGMKLLPF